MCKEIKGLKKEQLKQNRALERMSRKKAKTVGVVRLSDLKKSVQKKVNKFVRERDKDLPCISCQKYAESYDAGHFIAQGSSGLLRYNLNNIWKQCRACNHYKRGNLLEYRIALVKKIGLEQVEYLENHRHDTHSWTREELEQVVQTLPSKEVKGTV